MENLDRPATKRELEALFEPLATKRDLDTFATKRDLDTFATKRDLDTFATKRDLEALRMELKSDFEELDRSVRRHVEVLIENARTEFATLYDWTVATTDSLGRRVTHLETDHGNRLLSLETRVTRSEKRRK